jgi:acetyl esterase/lipase
VKNAVRIWALQPNFHWPLAAIESFAGLVPGRGHPATIRRVKLPHCRAELVSADGISGRRAILYLHGGAFLTGGLNTHRSLVTRLSRAADAVVLNVDYRMLPSHTVSEAVDDCIDGLRWLHRHGYPSKSVVVAGDSAGGFLAFMFTLSVIEHGGAVPAGIATVSPLADLSSARKLVHPNARRCSMFSSGVLPSFTKYVNQCHRRLAAAGSERGLIAPVDANLSHMPPVMIHASADELLLADAELMARRLEAAGVRCDLHVWQGQIHDFPLAADLLPEGRRAIEYLGDFVCEVTVPLAQPPAALAHDRSGPRALARALPRSRR